MAGLPRFSLAETAADGSPEERVDAHIEMGRLDEAELLLDDDEVRAELLVGRLRARRGEFLEALQHLTGEGADERRERARVLATLGRNDEALSLVEGTGDPRDDLLRAQVHLLLGEPAPASLALPSELAARAQTLGGRGERALRLVELELARGEVALQTGEPEAALRYLRRADGAARALGAAAIRPVIWSRLAEGHADAGNRWRALRAATRALDHAGDGVAAAAIPGIHFRAFQVYGMFGHRELADAAVESGHAVVVQLASGIGDHAYRETFFLDNRDCQRVVATWKGDAHWGREVLEGR